MNYVNNRKCHVEYCENTGRNCNLTFFLVPRDDPVKAAKWLSSLKMKPNLPKKKFICSDHFTMKNFTNTFKRRLIVSAVPTLQYKLKTEEATNLEECMESHFVWTNVNTLSNSEKPKDDKSDSDMCVVASIYVASEDKNDENDSENPKDDVPAENNIESVNSNPNPNDRVPVEKDIGNTNSSQNSLDGVPIEMTGHDYVVQNCTTQDQTENRNSHVADPILIQNYSPVSNNLMSCKENVAMNSSGQNIMMNPQPFAIISYDPRTAIQSNPKSIYPPVLTSRSHIQLPRTETQSETNPKSFFHQQNSPLLTSRSHPQFVSRELNQMNGQCGMTNNWRWLWAPHSSRTLPENTCILKTDDDCDKFAAVIARELKKMTNIHCRTNVQLNIQKILFEAKSGLYNT